MTTAALRRANARRILSQQNSLVSEIVGRTAPPNLMRTMSGAVSVDRTQTDHRWWSYFRRGKQPGYELGSVFAQPALNIMAAWALGDKFTPVTEAEPVDDRLLKFIDDEFDTLLTWYVDGLGLGDAYIIVNPDGSLSMPGPDTVEKITNDFDYKTVMAYKVTTRLDKVTIIDEYRLDGRTVTIREGGKETPFYFDNPLGEIPVIHWCPGREANELYGHPVYEAILKVFTEYHDTLSNSLTGIKIMGRPVPVAEGLEDPEAAKELNKTGDETVEDSLGNVKTRPVVDMADVEMFWLGKGATFKFASPGAFAQDSRLMLKALFLITLEFLNIPEFVWGGAIASSKASADAQMPAFVRIVALWRTMFERPLLDLLRIWSRTVSAFEFLPDAGRIQVTWPDVAGADEKILLAKIDQADRIGAITRETALRLMDLVEDPATEVEAADAEAETRRDAFDRTIDDLNNAEDEPPDGDSDEDPTEDGSEE